MEIQTFPYAKSVVLLTDTLASEETLATKIIMATKLFDSILVGTAEQAVDFIASIVESSIEYSVIGKDLGGNILLWNEGARRLYGYDPEEVVGKAHLDILHTRDTESPYIDTRQPCRCRRAPRVQSPLRATCDLGRDSDVV